MNLYQKGSLWRLWDLHIHTPGTKKNDQFIGSNLEEKWTNYVNTINASEQKISVIGITDYFSVENYFIFLDKISKGEITKQFDLVIPNVELRIYPITGSGKAINIHCIFNPSIAQEIETRFLSSLSFEYGESTYNATKQDLIRFGKAISNKNKLSDEIAYKKGVNQYMVSIEVLRNIFKADQDLKYNTLIVVANGNDGVSGLRKHKDFFEVQTGSVLEPTIESIYQFSDAIFSSNSADRDYFTGMGVDDEAAVIKKTKTLMPCYHGCDAHDNQTVFKPSLDRYCWIKSDPTFNGLKQTLYEPRDRVIIQATQVITKTGYQVIDKIIINHEYIQNAVIELNPGLNCIIGGRSTGKSILLSSITKKLQPTTLVKEDNPQYEQLAKKIANNLKVIWQDEKENNNREIEFFHQGYMVQYSRDIDMFDGLVQSILEEKAESNLFEIFDDFITKNKTTLQSQINHIFSIQEKINSKEQVISDTGDLVGIKTEMSKIQLEITKAKEGLEFSEEDYQIYHDKKEKISLNESEIKKLKSDNLLLNPLSTEKLVQELPSLINFSTDAKDSIIHLYSQVTAKFEEKWNEGVKKIDANIKEKIKTFSSKIESIKEEEIFIKGNLFLDKNQSLKELEEKHTQEQLKKEKIEKLIAEIQELKNNFTTTKTKIIETHKKYYSKANEIANQLTTSFEDLEIKAYPRFLTKKYNSLLHDSINLKSYERKEMASFNSIKNEDYEIEIEEKFNLLLEDKILLKHSYNNRNLIERILAESFYVISYQVIYESDKYNEMSEGKQAFVILKLLLDFSDKKCPILIDQPEDDLDNRAIYNDLVKYLKKKKNERQIILVTHNPNIVVGTDSELVIVANQHGINNKNRNNKKFQYITGSIENSFSLDNSTPFVLEQKGIREHICEVLEGGETAFKKREQRYNIKSLSL